MVFGMALGHLKMLNLLIKMIIENHHVILLLIFSTNQLLALSLNGLSKIIYPVGKVKLVADNGNFLALCTNNCGATVTTGIGTTVLSTPTIAPTTIIPLKNYDWIFTKSPNSELSQINYTSWKIQIYSDNQNLLDLYTSN